MGDFYVDMYQKMNENFSLDDNLKRALYLI